MNGIPLNSLIVHLTHTDISFLAAKNLYFNPIADFNLRSQKNRLRLLKEFASSRNTLEECSSRRNSFSGEEKPFKSNHFWDHQFNITEFTVIIALPPGKNAILAIERVPRID